MSEQTDEIALEAEDKMDRALDHMRTEFQGVRTGRASPAIVERINVEYYGADVPLQQLAGFSVPEARLLVVQPFDKGAMDAIEKAIRDSDIGLNPSNDGNVLRLAFPPLTEERRKELVKRVKGMAEDGRVAIRNVRRSARQQMEALEKDGDISADDLERAEKELEGVTKAKVDVVDEMLKTKEAELLEV